MFITFGFVAWSFHITDRQSSNRQRATWYVHHIRLNICIAGSEGRHVLHQLAEAFRKPTLAARNAKRHWWQEEAICRCLIRLFDHPRGSGKTTICTNNSRQDMLVPLSYSKLRRLLPPLLGEVIAWAVFLCADDPTRV